jgi:ArsR family transcriptional regulator
LLFCQICKHKQGCTITNDQHVLLEEKARIFRALGNPARLIIIEHLEQRRYCVSELSEIVGLDISTVSKHLSVLREAGIIASTKQKNQVYYELVMQCILNFFTCVESVVNTKMGIYHLETSKQSGEQEIKE